MKKQTFRIPDGCTEISIEQDGDMIITKFEKAKVEVEFKNGDIIKCARAIILLKRHGPDDSNLCHFRLYDDGDANCDCNYNWWNEPHRLATPSEAQLLFDALAKAGKQWNAEKLCIEDLKVEPKVGDCVKVISYVNSRELLFVHGGKSEFGNIKNKGDYIYNQNMVGSNTSLAFNSDYSIIQILTPTQFQAELSELGFEYDFDTDKIREKKWKPKLNERYYSIITINSTWAEHSVDERRMKDGLIFKTAQEAEVELDKIKSPNSK